MFRATGQVVTLMPVAPYKLVVGDRSGAIIAHVPHAWPTIPAPARSQFLLSDDELRRELIRITDWHADRLFSWVTGLGGTMFVNTVSRLVFDPERFRSDADEPMAAVGQGVVYTKTTQGERLRDLTHEARQAIVRELYEPYHEGLSALVGAKLRDFGECVILDCHSFATVPLPSESSQRTPRPDICVGTDSYHTPPALADALERTFAQEGLVVQRDDPFSGTIVPLDYYRLDPRVMSVMIEVRRGLYCDEDTGQPNADFDVVRDKVRRAVADALRASVTHPGLEDDAQPIARVRHGAQHQI